MKDEVAVLRALATEYAQIARMHDNGKKVRLHQAVNDLEQIRPVVLLDELPWSEMDFDGSLALRCSDAFLRQVEWFLRSHIYKHKYMPADMIVPPYISVPKVIHNSGIGIRRQEKTLATDRANNIVAHEYKDILKDEADVERITNPVLTYDAAATQQRFQLLGDIFGDIVPVKISGIAYFHTSPWDQIATLRGVTNLLLDLAERPQFMHRVVRRLTDADLSYLEQLEELALFDNDPHSLHCTPIHTKDLPHVKKTRKDIWGRGAAQIFASVSKTMHNEFDMQYMKETIGQCGLAYYGCCEPLDAKIDILEQLPNLRKISVTPWADVDRAAEAINKKYVLSAKPNPAAVAVPQLHKDGLRKEIGAILHACKRYGCACDIVLKDISTCAGRPQNIFEWQQVAMEMVRNY